MKLGGSVLTDKSRYRTPRPDVLARLAKELATVQGPLVVVHGAGSYGHVLAKRHKLADGADGTPEQRLAFAQVHADVRELSLLVLTALREAGLPAARHSTFDLARLDGGALAHFVSAPVGDALAAGLVPVLSGDAVLDASRGFGILSGDALMAELARAFRPRRAVFATDVDGIFDKDPKEGGATLLARIGRDAAASGAPPGAAKGDDVTGGMAGKLKRAREVARAGVPVHVVNGLVPGRVADALAGKDTVSTVVTD